MMYEGWDREALIRKIFNLERENEELKKELRSVRDERDDLSYRVRTELEPRLRQERRSYDAWATDPERR